MLVYQRVTQVMGNSCNNPYNSTSQTPLIIGNKPRRWGSLDSFINMFPSQPCFLLCDDIPTHRTCGLWASPLEILLFMLNLLILWSKWGVLRMMPGDACWSPHQMIPRGRVQLSLFNSFSKINTLQYIYHIKWPLCTLRGMSHFRKRICYTMLHPYSSCFVFRIPSFFL